MVGRVLREGGQEEVGKGGVKKIESEVSDNVDWGEKRNCIMMK